MRNADAGGLCRRSFVTGAGVLALGLAALPGAARAGLLDDVVARIIADKIADELPEGVRMGGLESVEISYGKDYSFGDWNLNGKAVVPWGPSLFECEPHLPNRALALVAAGLCCASGDSAGKTGHGEWLPGAYEALGFDLKEVELFSYPHSSKNVGGKGFDDEDYAFSIAHRAMGEGEDSFDLITIVMRGTSSGYESVGADFFGTWATAKTDWEGVRTFDGFVGFAEDAVRGLADFKARHPGWNSTGRVRYLVCGHSLGGAAAQLVAYYTSKHMDETYGFTFGALNALQDAEFQGYTNICNVYNEWDTYGPKGSPKPSYKPANGGKTFRNKIGKVINFSRDFRAAASSGEDWLVNHMMTGYYRALWEAVGLDNPIPYFKASPFGFSLDSRDAARECLAGWLDGAGRPADGSLECWEEGARGWEFSNLPDGAPARLAVSRDGLVWDLDAGRFVGGPTRQEATVGGAPGQSGAVPGQSSAPNQSGALSEGCWVAGGLDGAQVVELGSWPTSADGTPAPIEWYVIAKDSDRSLLLSKNVLDCVTYNDWDGDVTWESCTLRSWLNGEFLQGAFTEEERARIVEVRLPNPANPLYGTDAGPDTVDRVFCLSLDEVESCLGVPRQDWYDWDGRRNCPPHQDLIGMATDWAISKDIWYREEDSAFVIDEDGLGWLSVEGMSSWPGSTFLPGGGAAWWLRTPGERPNDAACVYDDGEVMPAGNPVDLWRNGVRPALWLVG